MGLPRISQTAARFLLSSVSNKTVKCRRFVSISLLVSRSSKLIFSGCIWMCCHLYQCIRLIGRVNLCLVKLICLHFVGITITFDNVCILRQDRSGAFNAANYICALNITRKVKLLAAAMLNDTESWITNHRFVHRVQTLRNWIAFWMCIPNTARVCVCSASLTGYRAGMGDCLWYWHSCSPVAHQLKFILCISTLFLNLHSHSVYGQLWMHVKMKWL